MLLAPIRNCSKMIITVARWGLLLCSLHIVSLANGFFLGSRPAWIRRPSFRYRSLHVLSDQQTQDKDDTSSTASFSDDDEDPTSAAQLRAVTFVNLPKDQEPDLLCDYLIEVGACSVSMTDASSRLPAK